MCPQRQVRVQKRRRGAAAVVVVVTIPVLIGMAALSVDVAVMFNTRADLQRSADAAALSAASSLLTDSMMAIRLGTDSTYYLSEVETAANARAVAVAALNPSLGKETTYLEASDIVLGYLDLSSATSVLVPNPAPPLHLNAVKVTVRRSAESANGDVGFFFAPIFGKMSTNVTASATAAFDTRVLGFVPSGGWLVPFTIDEDEYEAQLALKVDNYDYNEGDGDVDSGSDGIFEVNLYPDFVGPGNFGLLNMPGSSPPSEPEISVQIEEGVEPEDMEEDFGSQTIVYEDEYGNPITHTLSGNPGLTASLQSSVETRIGQVIGFLLHDGDAVAEEGNNFIYPTVALRFGRVLDVKFVGNNKYLYIQPAAFSGGRVILSGSGTTSLEDTSGLVVLAR